MCRGMVLRVFLRDFTLSTTLTESEECERVGARPLKQGLLAFSTLALARDCFLSSAPIRTRRRSRHAYTHSTCQLIFQDPSSRPGRPLARPRPAPQLPSPAALLLRPTPPSPDAPLLRPSSPRPPPPWPWPWPRHPPHPLAYCQAWASRWAAVAARGPRPPRSPPTLPPPRPPGLTSRSACAPAVSALTGPWATRPRCVTARSRWGA